MVKGATKKRYRVKRNRSKKLKGGNGAGEVINIHSKKDAVEAKIIALMERIETLSNSNSNSNSNANANEFNGFGEEYITNPHYISLQNLLEKDLKKYDSLDEESKSSIIGEITGIEKQLNEELAAKAEAQAQAEGLVAAAQAAQRTAEGQVAAAESRAQDAEAKAKAEAEAKAEAAEAEAKAKAEAEAKAEEEAAIQHKLRELTDEELAGLKREAEAEAQKELQELKRQTKFLEQENAEIKNLTSLRATLIAEIKALIGIESGEGTEKDFNQIQKDIKTELRNLRTEKAKLEKEKGTIKKLTEQKKSLLGQIEGIQKADGVLSGLRSKKADLDKAVNSLTADIGELKQAQTALADAKEELILAQNELAELKAKKARLVKSLETIWYRVLQKIVLTVNNEKRFDISKLACEEEIKGINLNEIDITRWNAFRKYLEELLKPEALKVMKSSCPNTSTDVVGLLPTQATETLCSISTIKDQTIVGNLINPAAAAAAEAAGGARKTKKKRRGQGRRRIRSKLVRKVNNQSSNKKNKKKSSIKRNKN